MNKNIINNQGVNGMSLPAHWFIVEEESSRDGKKRSSKGWSQRKTGRKSGDLPFLIFPA